MKPFRVFALLLLSIVLFSPSPARAGEAENQIIGECAASSGGMPAVFAECAIKQLTLTEIKKCFDGTGCFGPGNTMVQFNDWFNRTILGTCGAFHSQSEKEHQFLVLNNATSAVTFSAEAEQTDRTEFTLQPGHMALLTFDWCDSWVNIYGANESYSYDMGGVMEFVTGPDGNVQQYAVIRK